MVNAWWVKKGGCTGCVREGIVPTATHPRHLLSRRNTIAHVLPNNRNRKALPVISYSISSSFPLPGLSTTVPEQWRRVGADILLGESMLHPTNVTERPQSLHKPLHHWWSSWRSGRVRAQMGHLSHSCSNTQQVTLLVFSVSFLAAPSLCVCTYVCVYVGRESYWCFLELLHFLLCFFLFS